MRPLADAAVCRSEADWLVGINGTRAMTAFNSKLGGFQLTTVGRVQTPTLAIVVEREEKIKNYVSKDYWEVIATFKCEGGQYSGRWFDEQFTREKNSDTEFKAERILDKAKAETIARASLGQTGVVTEESKNTSQLSPLLFDLTSLQREANGRFGFSAKSTLQIAQALYERHKVLTYPRTDARALPEDYIGTVKSTLSSLGGMDAYAPYTEQVLKQGWVRPNKRIFNNAKISDHFAIIPTGLVPKALNEQESRIYDMVTRRFLAVFFPPAEYLVTTRITRVLNEPFKSDGKVMISSGWLSIYGKEAQEDGLPSLVPVKAGEQVLTESIEVNESKTKPPARFTEATLLSAMEGAGKLIEDEELREAMSAKGLGTPATRASIIEGLLFEKYLLRNGRELQPTTKAFDLMILLRGIDLTELCKPELTGDWEFKLKLMEQNRLGRTEFMSQIADMTRGIINKIKGYEHDTVPGDFGPLSAKCPKCGAEMHENYRKFECQNKECKYFLWKSIAGRRFEKAEVEDLLTKRAVGPLMGFRAKTGFLFSAALKLQDDLTIKFDFPQNPDSAENSAEPVDFSTQESLGACPKCGARIFEHGASYICEKAVGAERKCTFRSGKIILQQPVDRAQMTKLLQSGKTDLLKQFMSKKNRRFEAYLVINKEKKVGFEFEPRKSTAKKKTTRTSTKAAEKTAKPAVDEAK